MNKRYRGGARMVLRPQPVTVVNGLAALNAINAWRPFGRRSLLSVPGFMAGWPTSEMPTEALAGLLVANILFGRRGSSRGQLALNAGLLAGSSAALLGLRAVAAQASEGYDRAFQAEFGGDYRRQSVQPTFPGSDMSLGAAPGVVEMFGVRRRFVHDANLAYGSAGRANLLDIWRRDDLPRNGRAPVLIQVPGGAWTVGNKQAQAYPLLSHLAERGWICVAINYRLSPRHAWPAQIVDVKRAISWVRTHIAGYGGDRNFIAISGGSAGGHLASLAALTSGDPQWQPGFEDADTSVAAAAPLYAPYDLTNADGEGHSSLVPFLERLVMRAKQADNPDLFEVASPLYRVHAGAPPFLVSHGANDSLIPVEQARVFAQRLKATSAAPAIYVELPSAQHAFDIFGSVRANAAAAAIGHFLGVVYGRYQASVGAF